MSNYIPLFYEDAFIQASKTPSWFRSSLSSKKREGGGIVLVAIE